MSRLLGNPWQKLTPNAGLVWAALALLYALVQVGRHFAVVPVAVDWYLADLICLPLVLGLVLIVHRRRGRSPAWTLPRWHGAAAVVAYAVHFEAILPRFTANAVADPRDALSYLLGWLLFELLLNRPHEKSRDPKTAAFLSV